MPRKKKRDSAVYQFFMTLPNRMYPFSCIVAGKRVRGLTAYNRTLAQIRKKYGDGHYGAKLFAYRAVFHFVGAVLFVSFAAFASKAFFGGDAGLYILFAAAVFAISYQEFYFHPRHYSQRLPKSLIDWATWVAPIGLYLFTHLH